MLWLVCAAFFAWLAAREALRPFVRRAGYDRPDPEPIHKPWLVATSALAVALAWQPLDFWRLERALTIKARALSENPNAAVHCNTVFDTFFDQNVFAAGHADPASGRIVLQHPWCDRLREQMRRPRADGVGVVAVHLFAHEAMHVRGELNEAKTECQAIQRHVRAARLLGIPEATARAGGWRYFREDYARRAAVGGLAGMYHSALCAPGAAWDERLADSTWRAGG